MPTTTGYSFGEVVLVRFPFTDQRGAKQRPAVVISSDGYNQQRPDLILMAITSQVRPQLGFGEALIDDWQAAGLIKPSVIKPVVFTAEKTIMRKALGTLGQKDQEALRTSIEAILAG